MMDGILPGLQVFGRGVVVIEVLVVRPGFAWVRWRPGRSGSWRAGWRGVNWISWWILVSRVFLKRYVKVKIFESETVSESDL